MFIAIGIALFVVGIVGFIFSMDETMVMSEGQNPSGPGQWVLTFLSALTMLIGFGLMVIA
ncbi:MAG: hypothetical protein U1C72_02275 [Candidatus Pacearchaeota archaeon]|nr:hypothetical protein [Candidatus Pacearchaeota archaeon]